MFGVLAVIFVLFQIHLHVSKGAWKCSTLELKTYTQYKYYALSTYPNLFKLYSKCLFLNSYFFHKRLR